MWICWTFLQQVVEKHSFSTGVHPQKFHPPKTKDRYGNPNSCSMVFGWCGFLQHVWIEKSYGVQAGDETRARKYKHLMPQNGVLAKIMSSSNSSIETLCVCPCESCCVFFLLKKIPLSQRQRHRSTLPPPRINNASRSAGNGWFSKAEQPAVGAELSWPLDGIGRMSVILDILTTAFWGSYNHLISFKDAFGVYDLPRRAHRAGTHVVSFRFIWQLQLKIHSVHLSTPYPLDWQAFH